MSFHFKSLAATAVLGLSLAGCVDDSASNGTSTVSLNRNVLIVNQTGQTIWRFYGSRITTNSWEEDILGSTVLSNGESINIDFDDGTGSCVFDMKAEFRDGSSIVQNEVNVCTAAAVTFR